jgi:glycine/D-amino acid oxidase-like deaminating enzyme
MRTRHGVSYWLDRYPKARQPSYPRLRGDVDTQVAIVGGGLTGCAAACAFAMAGVRVVLLEADRLAQGNTGGCPGLLRLEPAVPFVSLQERHGLRAARMAWRAFRRAGLDLGATIRRLRIRCEFVPDAALRVGLTAAEERPLKREMAAMRAAGVEGTWLTPARLKQETGLAGIGAIRSAGDGYIDPYRVALGLAAAAAKRKAVVHEQSPVVRLKTRSDGVDVTTDGGVVHAQWVVVAANLPSKMFAPLRRHFRSMETYCVLTDSLPSFVRREFGRSRAILIDREFPAHILRRTADDRLLGMGADQTRQPPRANQKAVIQRTGQLMYEISRLYPALSGVRPEYGWSVPVSAPIDGLPVVGPHRRYPRHLFVLGLGHSGIGASWLAARALVRHYQGTATKEDEFFGFSRLR